MRLFPPPWEESGHPVFPKTPEPLSTSDVLTATPKIAIGLGSIYGAGRKLLGRPGPSGILSAIGSTAMLLVGLDAAHDYYILSSMRKSEDVSVILENDRVPMPAVKLFERTNSYTKDDYAMTGALLAGAMMVFIPRRPPVAGAVTVAFPARFSMSRIAGGMAIGSVIGSYGAVAFNLQTYYDAYAKRKKDVETAEKLYIQKMQRPPSTWIYRTHETEGASLSFTTTFKQPRGSIFLGGHSDEDVHSSSITPLPMGSAPHNSVMLDGKQVYLPNRDYSWKPVTAAEGVDILNKELEELGADRAMLAREAEFLWHEIAARESKYIQERDIGTENKDQIKQRKSLELLNSMHHNLWNEISHLDWIIADSKKQLLQIQSKGSWLPEKGVGYVDPKTYVPEGILEKVRDHKEAIEAHLEAMDSVVVLGSEHRQRLQDDKKEMEGNGAATSELLEDFEKRR